MEDKLKISEHISYHEATNSPTALRLGIDNTPNAEQLEAMSLVANVGFEPLRAWYKRPIKVNSFFRCDALNKAVNGSKTSGHCKGNSIDADAGSKEENEKLFNWLKANVKYDQLINEYDFSWVHFSILKTGNRNQTLVIT